jgi:cytochrome c
MKIGFAVSGVRFSGLGQLPVRLLRCRHCLRHFERISAKILPVLCFLLFIVQPVMVQGQQTPAELQKESGEACISSAKTRPTVAMIIDKVDKACGLLGKEGKGAFSKFKGKDSEFIFAGTYIWINDMKGVMRMDPMMPSMEGMPLVDVKDSKGKRLFFEFNKLAKEKGKGWVDYWWAKPGETNPFRKISYIKKCKIDGEDMVVSCGIYDLPEDQISQLLLNQATKEELAKNTEAACVASEAIRPTAEMIINKVNKACELLTKEGKTAFPKFKGQNSEFIFSGTYVWINDMTGVMRMHPIQVNLEGQQLIGWQDSNGKPIFAEFIKTVKEKGSGWIDYKWPKPGEKNPSRKVSYVKSCKIDGEEMVVGCGVYDLPDYLIDKLIK